MKMSIMASHRTRLLTSVAAVLLLLAHGWGRLTEPARAGAASALFVQAEAAQGFAAPGNSAPANFLVVVTDETGAPVTNLALANFTVINHFLIPGQVCGFSNKIVTFNNVGTGAYQLQVDLAQRACTWVKGDYLAQVMVVDGGRNGQAPVKMSVN